MANELTISANLAYLDTNNVQEELAIESLRQSVTTKIIGRSQQVIATSETAITLAGVSSVGWLMLINLDATNFVNIKTAASGTIFAKLPPGGFCVLYLGSGVTAPVAIADTASCVIDKLICSQ